MRRDAIDQQPFDFEPGDVVSWRRRCLRRAGFDAGLAGALAEDRRIDLHAVLGLVDRGCAPELAARILAPLDEKSTGPG
jgi:hypothetical protein